MILIVSGEGPSDIGACLVPGGQCNGANYRIGPMGRLIDKIAEQEGGYSPHDIGGLEFVSESVRADLAKGLKMTFVIGKRRDYETGSFFKEARALAALAQEQTAADGCPRGVVLFRDADGTRSTERGLYESRIKSIYDGFTAQDFDRGVAMVPKPKSEAWLICALKRNAYQNCAALEDDLSGNDHAPEPAKEQLGGLLNQRGLEVHDLAEMVDDGQIDALHAGLREMPSFAQFDSRLRQVVRSL